MLINPDGQSLGLVSGGCLEADIRLNARKVLAFAQAKTILYDSMDQENIAAELGLGCNGRVEVLVQPLQKPHRDIFMQLLERMESGESSYLLHCFQADNPESLNALVILDSEGSLLGSATQIDPPELSQSSFRRKHQVVTDKDRSWSLSLHRPPVNLWVVGGGVDAQPMVALAASLGWRVTLADHRPAYGREEDFAFAETFVRERPDAFSGEITADAAVVMTHNLELDASWLRRLQDSQSLRYVGLLGPADRRNEALHLAGIGSDSSLHGILHGPMGFDIGGDIPESVALSTLSQCHQILFQNELRRED